MEVSGEGHEELSCIEDNSESNIHSDLTKFIGKRKLFFSAEFSDNDTIATFKSIMLPPEPDNTCKTNPNSLLQMPQSGLLQNQHVNNHVDAIVPNFNMSKYNMSKFNISRPIVNLIINGSDRFVFIDSGATLSLIQQNCVNNK